MSSGERSAGKHEAVMSVWQRLLQRHMTLLGPSVWTGRALQAERNDLKSWSCGSVSGLFAEPLSSWPSWISARVRSHSRLGPEGQKGHLIANALARPFSISSFRLADLSGKAIAISRAYIRHRVQSTWP